MQKNIVCKDIANVNWNQLVKKKMKRWRKSLKNRINKGGKQMTRKKRKDQGQLVVANLELILLQNLEVVPDHVQDLNLKGSPGVLHAHDLGPSQDLVQDRTQDQGIINKIIFFLIILFFVRFRSKSTSRSRSRSKSSSRSKSGSRSRSVSRSRSKSGSRSRSGSRSQSRSRSGTPAARRSTSRFKSRSRSKSASASGSEDKSGTDSDSD